MRLVSRYILNSLLVKAANTPYNLLGFHLPIFADYVILSKCIILDSGM